MEREVREAAKRLWSLPTIAKLVGVPRETLRDWVKRDDDFRQSIARARNDALEPIVDGLLELAASAKDERIRIEAARMVLGRQATDDWGRKLDPPPAGEDGAAPVQHTVYAVDCPDRVPDPEPGAAGE